jgi:hypothetical protein
VAHTYGDVLWSLRSIQRDRHSARHVWLNSQAMCLYFLAGLADGALMPCFALWAQQEARLPAKFISLLVACYAGGELIATPFWTASPTVWRNVFHALAPASRASYMAAVSTANDLKDTVGPASGMFLYEISARLPWLLGVPLALFAAWALAMTIKRGKPPKSPVNRKAHQHGRSKPPLFVTYR